MAITTDSLYSVESGGVTYDTVGLSKTLNNYTADEIWDYVFCSSTSNQLYHIGYGGPGMTYYTYQGSDNYVPLELRYEATNHNNMYFHANQEMDNPDGLYMRMIWLQRTSNGSDKYITRGNVYYKLITMFNAPHYVYECNTPQIVDNSHGATSWDAGSYLYYSTGAGLYYYNNLTAETPVRINIPRVVPAIIFKDRNDHVYILPYRQNMSEFVTKENTQVSGWSPSCANQFYDWTGDHCIAFPVVCDVLYHYLNSTSGELTNPYSDGSRLPEGSGIYATASWSTSTISHLISSWECGGSAQTAYGLGFRTVNYFRDVENCKKFFSLAGLHFKADKIYKPVIEDGYVTGFTDDLETPSELDDWNGITKHDVPPTPPAPEPTPPAPYDDDPWHGVNYGSGGYGASPFCTSYAMTGAELTGLAAWGGKTEEQGGPKAGYDYMPSIISLIELPMEVSGTTPSTVKFSRGTLGGYDSNIVDTGVSGNPITAGCQRYNLGSVTLPLRMNERGYPFLDWDTVIELYMPFVGMFSLDPYAVLGKTITAFLDLDVLNGTVCGYAYVINNGERLPVAYGSAQVGVSLPVTSEGAASARLALTTANTNLGSSIVSGLLQLGTLASAGGINNVRNSDTWAAMNSVRSSGLAAQAARSSFAAGAANSVNNYASGTAKSGIFNSFMNWGLSLKQLQSSNNTQVNGSLGGGSFSGWSAPNEAYVKIIRPHAAGGAATRAYGKTHAYPYETAATLAECTGLTFAVNPDMSGITKATDAERSQIAEILMGGVIA